MKSDGEGVYPLWVLAVSVRIVDEGGLEIISMVDWVQSVSKSSGRMAYGRLILDRIVQD